MFSLEPLLEWLKAKRAILLYTLIIHICFLVVFGTYYGDFSIALYAVLLSLVLGLIFAIYSFLKFSCVYKALRQVCGNFPTSNLPKPSNTIEDSYTSIIDTLETERLRLETENEKIIVECKDYYTLWAHQIKTPIAVMQLLLQHSAKSMPSEVAADMEHAIFETNSYVDMVLQYQRLYTFQSDLSLNRFDLKKLVSQSIKNCASLFIYKNLPVKMGNINTSIVTDEKWFCFVLEQVISNSTKYTRAGQIEIFIQDTDTLVIKDTGIGILEQDLPRVFELGFTGTVGHHERSSTGIGLYLCHKILGHLGFSISITSANGIGTAVALHLHQEELDIY